MQNRFNGCWQMAYASGFRQAAGRVDQLVGRVAALALCGLLCPSSPLYCVHLGLGIAA